MPDFLFCNTENAENDHSASNALRNTPPSNLSVYFKRILISTSIFKLKPLELQTDNSCLSARVKLNQQKLIH